MISKKNYTPTPVGSAIIYADGSTSTCSTSNYFLVSPVPSWQAGYVLQIHLKWGGNTGSYNATSAPSNANRTINILSNYVYIYTTGGTNITSISLGASANTEYWIRLSWNGSVYTVEKSTDGETWTTSGTYTSSLTLNTGKQLWFGRAGDGYDYSFGGIFYFEDTWLKNGNDQIVWSAAELADASGNVTVTEGYYNSGTYVLTPPFIKTAFADLVSNQTIACKNNIFRLQ